MKLSRGALLRAVLGIAISLVALWILATSVNLGAAFDVVLAADPRWLLLAGAFLVIDVLLRALRWQRLLAPVGRVGFRPALGALLVGYLANNVLPARLGELVRSHDLGERTGLSRATTLGTIVVERVIDTVVVVAIASLAILVLSVRGVVASAVLAGLALTALLVAGLLFGIAAHRLPGADRVVAYLERWPRLRAAGARLRDGLRVAGRPRTVVEAVVLTIAAWGATVLAFAATGQSIGLELRIADAALMASGIALATAIPAGPGYLGTYELAAATIGRSLGLPDAQALALGFLVHVLTLAITSIGGIAAIVLRGTRDSHGSRGSHDSPGSEASEAADSVDPAA